MRKVRAKPHRPSPEVLRRRHGTLPFTVVSDTTPLIGRDRELEVLRQHLLSETVRLLTVTGPGGVGKTRLALAAVRYIEPTFHGGVYFVDALPLLDTAQLDHAIARALNLEGTTSSPEGVTGYLRRRRALLVLDNFEHLLPAATRVAELVRDCPHLKVLVTSREALNLRLEQRMVLGGLALPSLARPTPEVVARAASATLFLARARLVQPDFALTPAHARALAELLHRLDGMPLAIQIAAARINVLSPAAMLERLQGRTLLSSEEARDVPARQHTLRDTIEWSHALLDKDEEELFHQLAVFVGGWTLEAAEAITPSRDSGPPLWQTLQSLVKKSLVQTYQVGDADFRYRMLETVRDYASERLAASGQLETIRQRHADYYLALVERAEREWYGPEEKGWLLRMEQEHENVQAVRRWAETKGDGELSLRVAAALADFWWVSDHLRDGRRWLEEALATSPEAPPQLRTKALIGIGFLAALMGDAREARGLLHQAVELAAGEPVATARSLTRLGLVAFSEDDAPGAEALLEQSLAISQAVPQRSRIATLFLLGIARMRLGALDRAEDALMQSLELARRVGNRRWAVSATSYLAQIRLKRGDAAGAAELAAEALTSAGEVLQTTALWAAVVTAAMISAHRGDFERAAGLLAAEEAWSTSTGHIVTGTSARDRAEIVGRARRRMGNLAYEKAERYGQSLSPDDAVEYAKAAFQSVVPVGPQPAAASRTESDPSSLSSREQAVLCLIAEGLLNKQIATALGIGERTVKTYVSSAMKKLGADNRAQAAVAAVQRGLIE